GAADADTLAGRCRPRLPPRQGRSGTASGIGTCRLRQTLGRRGCPAQEGRDETVTSPRCDRSLHAPARSALFACTDVLPPISPATVRAVWLADLTPEQVTSPRHGLFVFVPDSLVDEQDGCYGLEAAGPPGVSRTVQFARGETDEGLDLVQPYVVEGE